MKFVLKLRTSWNHVTKKEVEAKDLAQLQKIIDQKHPFWSRNWERATKERTFEK